MATIFQAEDFSVKESKRSGFLSEEATELLAGYRCISERKEARSTETKIKVGHVLASLAFFYERLRNTVDYKGEHLLRRNAIERILKRLLWENPALVSYPQNLSENLVKELIWARYIENGSIPKSKIEKLAQILAKYFKFLALVPEKKFVIGPSIKDWFLGVASCEIEEVLDESLLANEILAKAMTSWFDKRFDWKDGGISQEKKKIQILIAIQRSLFKADDERLRFNLLNYLIPSWKNISINEVENISREVFEVREEIEKDLNYLGKIKLYRIIQKEAAAFKILKEVIEADVESVPEIFSDPKKLSDTVYEVCDYKYDEIGRRVSTGIKRSIIYIFVTKVVFALFLEIPYEYFFVGSIRTIPLVFNLLTPPFLMLMLGLSIKKPDEENTQKILDKINNFIYRQDLAEKEAFSLAAKPRIRLIDKVFLVLYALLFLITFGGLSLVLYQLHFSIFGAIVFYMFMSLVLLFGFRVAFSASELNVSEARVGFFANLISTITLPLLNLGVWLSSQLVRFNFLIVLLDFLIEAPLKNILGLFEEWSLFMKEKREEIVEVPTQQ